jgi:4-hydroxybenzoate polyprenyltransferase
MRMTVGVCLVCDLIWSGGILAGCTYLVFWRDHSGWWYILAVLLMSAWNCRRYRTPEQMAADKEPT